MYFSTKYTKYISTNIKTSLNTAAIAVDSIKNIGTKGALFDEATLMAYKQQLESLTITQQKMALMTTNLTAAQREQVLSYIASTTATKSLTAEQALSCTADEKRILVKAGLIAEEELEKGAVINLTQEKLKEILADETLNATEKNTILTKFGVTGANLTEASSWEVLGKSIGKATIAMMKWLFLTPAGWATLAIGGVVGLIGAYAKWGPTLENTREKLEDLKSECDTIASDLSSVNSELETTKQRMDELEGKGTLTFTEKEEYDNLVKTNNELQRKIDLLELEQKTKNKEKNKTFVETMEKDVYSTDYYRDGLDDGKIKKGQAGRSEHRTTTTEQAYIIQQFNDREKLLDDLAKAKTEAERKRIQEQIDEIDKYLSDRNEQFKSDADGIEYIQNPTTDDEKAVNAWLDYINDFQDRMAIAMGGDNAKTNAFNRIVDNWQFDDTVQGLQDLGKQGKVTAEMLDDPKYDAFIQKLVDLGAIDSADALDEIALAFNNVGTEAEKSGEKVNETAISLKDVAKTLSTLQSKYEELKSAQDEYNSTGAISADTMQKLIDNDLLQYLDFSSGKLQINTDALLAEGEAAKVAAIQNLQKAMAEDLAAVAAGRDAEASTLAQTAIEGLGNNAEKTGNQAKTAAGQLAGFAVAAEAAKKGAEGNLGEGVNVDDYRAKADAIISAYTSAANSIGNITIASPKSSNSQKSDTSDKIKDTSDKIKDTSDKIKDINEQLDDLAKTEALDALKYKFDQLEQSIEKVDNAMSLLDTTLDLQAENDYVGKLETVTRQLDLAQQKSALLRDEFAQLSNTQYNTADEANELATRMKSVADSIADNSKNIIEYGRSISEYYMSAMSSIASMSDASIERATSLFERNVKTLQEGGLTGLQFNLSPIVPQSAFEKQRQENRDMEDEMRSYYDTVAEMQKTALDMQYQETVADNERKRQELLGSLNEAMSAQQSYSIGTQSLQKSTNRITSQEQVQDDNNKLAEEQSFISSMEENIAGLNNWMVENPIKAPELDKTSWNKLATDIEEQVKNMGKTFSDFRLPNLSLGESEGGYNGSGGKGIVSVAASYAGTPYVYGGGHGDGGKNGLDCSGYVSAVLTDMGWTGGATTAEGFKSVGTKVSKSDMQPGDILVIDWDGGGVADHVGIYAGNGQMWHSSGNSSNTASNPGRGVCLGNVPDGSVVQVRRTPYSVYAKGTKDFAVYGDNINGVAGENYKPEILVDKKTGEMTTIDEPTFIDTGKYDVVGEKTTARVLNKYATGTPTTDSEILSYIKRASEETGVPANIIMAVMDQETGYTWYDSVSDGTAYSHGYMMLYDNGAIADIKQKYGEEYANQAKTDKYTNVLEGARLLASKYQEYGDWQTAISRYNGKGEKANKYGETVYARAYSSDFIEAANNLGSIASYTSDTANNTSSTAKNILEFRKSFDSQLQEWINGGDSTSTSSTTEDELLAYIKENIKLSEYDNEEFIKKWDAFQEINEKGNIKFKALDEFLLKSVGTGNYNATKDSVVKEINDYTNAIMEASAEANLAELKRQHDINKDVANKMLAFYNYKKAEGATADELTTIINLYNKQLEKVNDISDKWVSTMQSITDYLMSQDATKLQAHDDRLSWIEKENEEFTRQYENTDENDFASKTALAEQIVDRHNQIISENVKKQNTAHQNVLDLYNNEDYMPIFERYDVEAWFDASAEATAKYKEELAALSATNSELATVMTQVFAIIQQNKKAFYEANEAIQSTNESLIDFNRNRKLENVDVYIKYQERLVEALNFDASISQSLSTAKEGMYNIFKTLRDEKAEMDKELKANMQIDDWLTEDTRRQLFNLDDYEGQMGVINEIEAEANSLYVKYQNDLANLKEDELYKEEEITAEYNRQLESLQDKLSIAKADLQLAKDKAAFENALKERDTQIIMGNRVQNVADPERLREAAMKMAESDNNLENEQKTSQENQDIRNMEIATGMINQEKAAIQNRIDMINDMTSAEREALAGYIEPIEIIGAKLNAISKTNPERIINEDNSNKVLSGLDLTKRDGWSLTGDYSEMVEMFNNLLENGYYKKNTFEYDMVKNLVEWIKWQHDNKTTSDAYNYGYSLYNADNAYLWGKGAMKIYSDDAFRVMSQRAVPIDEYINDIISSRIDEEKLNVVVSGGINVVTNNPQSTYPSFLQGYEELDGVSMFQQTLGVDEDAASAIFERFKVGNIAPTTDTFVTLAEMAKVWGNASDTRGNTDNSVHMENVNITLEKPVTNPNDFVQQFINKVYSEYSTTNNQR